MIWILLILALLLGAVVLVMLLRRPAPPPRATPLPLAERPAVPVPPAVPQAATVETPPSPERPLPPELVSFQMRAAAELAPDPLEALTAELRRIPRPPRSLHQLVSPEFIATATSTEMSELVMAEPQIAAKVLATVNSPLYGLQKTVTSIGQAITFLGMNTVRGIALQYMLDEAFQADSPQARRLFDQLWTASALASELCTRLTKQLALPEAGALVTQLVLSFLGHMAVASLAQGRQRPEMTDLALPLPVRYQAQQDTLGLCAPEIGRLLMREWGLPASIVDGVAGIERVLTEPASRAPDAAAGARMAVAYLSARLGERLASGVLADLGAFHCHEDNSPDLHHCRSYAALPRLANLPALLGAPDNVQSVSAFLASRRNA